MRTYGPIQPDKALPFTRDILRQLLCFPDNTRLGRFTLSKSTQLAMSFFAMIEAGAESGLRLDECSVSAVRDWDMSKMSRASVVYYFGKTRVYVIDPEPWQLRSMTPVDGVCVMPATSKCDFDGSKHGGKLIFLPFRANHIWNGARAIRRPGEQEQREQQQQQQQQQ